MIYRKSNNTILPQGEKEGRSVYINDTYVDIIAYALNVVESIEIPERSTYKEAINSEEAAEWTIGMTKEMESLHNIRHRS